MSAKCVQGHPLWESSEQSCFEEFQKSKQEPFDLTCQVLTHPQTTLKTQCAKLIKGVLMVLYTRQGFFYRFSTKENLHIKLHITAVNFKEKKNYTIFFSVMQPNVYLKQIPLLFRPAVNQKGEEFLPGDRRTAGPVYHWSGLVPPLVWNKTWTENNQIRRIQPPSCHHYCWKEWPLTESQAPSFSCPHADSGKLLSENPLTYMKYFLQPAWQISWAVHSLLQWSTE